MSVVIRTGAVSPGGWELLSKLSFDNENFEVNFAVPDGYESLKVEWSLTDSASDQPILLRFNDDASTSNYTSTRHWYAASHSTSTTTGFTGAMLSWVGQISNGVFTVALNKGTYGNTGTGYNEYVTNEHFTEHISFRWPNTLDDVVKLTLLTSPLTAVTGTVYIYGRK